MSLIEGMKTLDNTKLISMQGSDKQVLSQQLLNEKEKLLYSNLLQLTDGNSMLHASLILLTLINESDSEIPEILIKTHSADNPYFVNKKGNKTKHKLARTSRIW
ncbi:hypothetical protein WUBG_10344 [Wuchereria bancrofti]|uniref:Uncharacterized protein n=1 Tax=Wuchereria bancrofti TaxID=6293 RepID=J9E8U7_WUCBA|nr:hypothetical protein WUBG_10344 [Wuchereria bancrofti]